MRVLCADDDRIWNLISQRWLVRWDYEPTFVANSHDALHVLSQGEAPAIAIISWMLPGLGGLEVCRKIRSLGMAQYTYIILLTGMDTQDDVVAGLEAGADDYITKPVNPGELERRLHCGRRIIDLQSSLIQSRLDVERGVREREILQTELRHAQKLEAVGQLTAGIAHELETPIGRLSEGVGAMRASIGEICSGDSSEERPALRSSLDKLSMGLDGAVASVDQLATIVRAMRGFARSGAEHMGYADINEMLQNTIVVARHEYRPVADIELNLGELPQVFCQVGDLGQAFLHFIVNAAHAVSEENQEQGRERGTIRIQSRSIADGESVEITFEDDGCGMDETIQQRIFEPFFTTKAVGIGTGQGLPVCHSIVVERHAGTISVESDVGRGTRFRVRLPVHAGTLEEDDSQAA